APRTTRRLSPADAARLRPVLRGLMLHNARLLLGLLATLVVVGLATFLAVKHTRDQAPPLWAAVGLLAGGAVWLLAGFLGLLGSALCLFVPREAGVRPVLAAALLCDSATVPFGVVASFLGWSPVLSWGLGLFSWVLFMAFL